MDNKEVNQVNENKEVATVVSKEKTNAVIQFIVIVVFLILAFLLSWILGMKQLENTKKESEVVKEQNIPVITEEVKLAIDVKEGENFSTNLDYILQNVFNDINHLVPDNMRKSTNILSDEVIKFKIAYYTAERYGDADSKLYNVNSNGVDEAGCYAIKYEYFKTYYKELFGEDFNREVLNKFGDSFIQRGDYLFGTVLSGAKNNYKLSAESFLQNGEKYYFTVLVNELDENEQITLSYKVKLELSKLNDKYLINSIIIA